MGASLRSTLATWRTVLCSPLATLHGNRPVNLTNLRGDLFGGLTTGIVALPLALALGVASGAGPEAGLYSAIVCGILAAVFGGTPTQISGPTAGMTVILVGVYAQLGTRGLFAAMFLGGVFQLIMAAMRVGKVVHLLPRPVVAGFTNGIAALIFWNQFRDVFLPGGAMNTPTQMLMTAAVVVLILAWPRLAGPVRAIPASLVALLAVTALTAGFGLPVRLLGDLPSGLPWPGNPLAGVTWTDLPTLAKAGLIIALLGTMESLLASLVADEMTGTRHRSDREIFGQGLANAVAPMFGGLAGTGAIVRTAVNIRAGGRTPLAAIFHSALVLAVLMGLGKFAAHIPVPALWGILIATAIGMVEWHDLKRLDRIPVADSVVMLATLAFTVVEDLIIGVATGITLSVTVFTLRMMWIPVNRLETSEATLLGVHGPLFFGVAKRFADETESARPDRPQIWDLSSVTVIDQTGAETLKRAKLRAKQGGTPVYLCGCNEQIRAVLERLGVLGLWPPERVVQRVEEALAATARLAAPVG